MHWTAFKKVLKVYKKEYFVTGDVPGSAMGPIHSLIFQLLVKGAVELRVTDKSKVGGYKLNDSHAEICLTAEFLESDSWDSLNWVELTTNVS